MRQEYDDSNWRKEWENYTSNKKELELLKNGAKSISQGWYLGALYDRWKRMKGYNKFNPKENTGQCQSSFMDFENKIKNSDF